MYQSRNSGMCLHVSYSLKPKRDLETLLKLAGNTCVSAITVSQHIFQKRPTVNEQDLFVFFLNNHFYVSRFGPNFPYFKTSQVTYETIDASIWTITFPQYSHLQSQQPLLTAHIWHPLRLCEWQGRKWGVQSHEDG